MCCSLACRQYVRGLPWGISGVLRDATGDWNAAVFLDGGLMLVSFVLQCLVRERKPGSRFVRDAG
jgi:hypothetical protein